MTHCDDDTMETAVKVLVECQGDDAVRDAAAGPCIHTHAAAGGGAYWLHVQERLLPASRLAAARSAALKSKVSSQ